jgi:hypothetical protein
VKMDQVCQDKIGRLGGVAGSVVLYVSSLMYSTGAFEEIASDIGIWAKGKK